MLRVFRGSTRSSQPWLTGVGGRLPGKGASHVGFALVDAIAAGDDNGFAVGTGKADVRGIAGSAGWRQDQVDTTRLIEDLDAKSGGDE